MPFDQFQWLIRIKSVEREYLAARLAVDWLSEQVRLDPTLLHGDLRQRDLAHTSELLEGTYIIRLFAEFESGTPRPPSRIRDLIQRLASTCKVGHDLLKNAHDVREYRNALVHEREGDIVNIPIAQARGHLCKFLSRLR